jgi:hypothetical protein
MTTDNVFIEQQIVSVVREILTERVNEMLCDMRFPVPPVEFGDYFGGFAVVPAVVLSSCERTEKERIVRLDAYSLTVTFNLPETPESEQQCYAYSGAISRAIYDNPTLCGVADRAVITGKKYLSPKKPNCGEGWQLVITLRITVEGK